MGDSRARATAQQGRPHRKGPAGRWSIVAYVAVTVTVGSLLAATGPATASPVRDRAGATLRYTDYGVPHISARSWRGLGYGNGYAQARDNICTLADAYVTARGDRSRFFGPDGTYVFSGSGAQENNLASDLFYRRVGADRVIERQLARPAPAGPRAEVRAMVRGYVAGYNRWLAETGVAHLPDPTCRGKSWVRPISVMDAYRRFLQVAILAGSANTFNGQAAAQPPSAGAAARSSSPTARPDATRSPRPAVTVTDRTAGSNAIAIGSAGSRNGHGVLLGNPHFPWAGAQRFWQSQMTLPGRFNVTGAALLGVPLVLIGHTAQMAWSHTVTTSKPWGLFALKLAPGDPTSYLVDGRREAMTRTRISVPAKTASGGTTTITRTLYGTRWGPVTTDAAGISLPWTSAGAYAFHDLDYGQFRFLNTWFGLDTAQSSRQALDVLHRTQGIPWVNTIASDDAGQALYADVSMTPNVDDARAARCSTAAGKALLATSGIPLLDGSRSACAWGNDPDARQRGSLGPSRMPYLFRRDYVTNSNNSPWLSNPRAPLTGYPRVVGDIGTARSLRTRMGLVAVQQRIAGTDGLGRSGFDRVRMQQVVFSDRALAGELAGRAAARMCADLPGGTAQGSSGPVDVRAACPVLARWDRKVDISSRGALLFIRFWERASQLTTGLWRHPFDPADSVHTPNTLDTSSPGVQAALADAVAELRKAGIPLASRLGEYQYVTRAGRRIPLPGGPESLGVLNKQGANWDPTAGYTTIDYGSTTSFVQVVAFDGSRCPDASTLLTYGQSANPASRHSYDQTRLFSRGRFVPDRFCAGDVRRATRFVIRL